MASLTDLVRFVATAGGTADLVYSSAVLGCQSPAAGNVQNGVKYKWYSVSADQTQWELFEGAWNSGTTTAPRTTVLANSAGTGSAPGQSGAGAKINFTLAPQVIIVGVAEDIVSPAIIRGYLAGLTLSTAGSSTTFSVAAGSTVDSGNTDLINLPASIIKTTSAWAVGSGNGSLDTGVIAINTWYHAHLIKRVDTMVVDVLTSLSASAPALPSGYTVARRIGAMKTDGASKWTLFLQNGDLFTWGLPVLDVNAAAVSATPTLTTLSVPPGVQVRARGHLGYANGTVGKTVLVYPPGTSTQPGGVTGNASISSLVASSVSFNEQEILTNTSAQIVFVGDGTGSTYWVTHAWIDRRGQDS